MVETAAVNSLVKNRCSQCIHRLVTCMLCGKRKGISYRIVFVWATIGYRNTMTFNSFFEQIWLPEFVSNIHSTQLETCLDQVLAD